MKKIYLLITLSLLLSGCTLNKANAPTDDNTGNAQNEPIENSSLNLNNQNLSQIPEYVFKLSNLKSLNVSNNNIDGAIQAEIRHLQNLRSLDASNNKMTGLPAEIGQLQKLEILNLSNNQLTGLPHELGNLKNLEILNLSNNNYSRYDLDIIEKNLPDKVNIIK